MIQPKFTSYIICFSNIPGITMQQTQIQFTFDMQIESIMRLHSDEASSGSDLMTKN